MFFILKNEMSTDPMHGKSNYPLLMHILSHFEINVNKLLVDFLLSLGIDKISFIGHDHPLLTHLEALSGKY